MPTFHSGPKPHEIIKVPIIIINQRGLQVSLSQWTLVLRGNFLCTAVAVSLCQRGGHHEHGNKFSCNGYQFLSNNHKTIILKIWYNHYGHSHGSAWFQEWPQIVVKTFFQHSSSHDKIRNLWENQWDQLKGAKTSSGAIASLRGFPVKSIQSFICIP